MRSAERPSCSLMPYGYRFCVAAAVSVTEQFGCFQEAAGRASRLPVIAVLRIAVRALFGIPVVQDRPQERAAVLSQSLAGNLDGVPTGVLRNHQNHGVCVAAEKPGVRHLQHGWRINQNHLEFGLEPAQESAELRFEQESRILALSAGQQE